MTLEGHEQDLVVRDPDHGQTEGHLVLLLCSKMAPRIFFFLRSRTTLTNFIMSKWTQLGNPPFLVQTLFGNKAVRNPDKNSFISAGRFVGRNGLTPRALWSGAAPSFSDGQTGLTVPGLTGLRLLYGVLFPPQIFVWSSKFQAI